MAKLRLLHDSFSPAFRLPYGALRPSGQVRLALYLTLDPAPESAQALDSAPFSHEEGANVAEGVDETYLAEHADYLDLGPGEVGPLEVRLIYRMEEAEGASFAQDQGVKTQSLLMEKSQDGPFYQSKLSLGPAPGLLFYHFEIETRAGLFFYGKKERALSGRGRLSQANPLDYQITLYERPAAQPDWYTGGLTYQVYVDRFSRRVKDELPACHKKNQLLHLCWQDLPHYIREPKTGAISHWDFFGGSLAGLEERLSYLSFLGVTCLYLNPIFEARSNHKYDTADYHKIDPFYGDEASFTALSKRAQALGIRIILDGVFSHTGSDSIYFNKEGSYDSLGAYQSKDSPYYNWYDFTDYPTEYAAWWGVLDLPSVDENHPGFRELILGKDPVGVVPYWLLAGASGWRLDVADELPDDFIQDIRARMEEVRPDSLLLGEVWEDASNKVSYDKRRSYLVKKSLDATMNYPFRRAVLGFLQGNLSGQRAFLELKTLEEHYPRSHFLNNLNILGSHDSRRILTELSLRKDLLLLALVWQAAFPGVFHLYYGDEAGLLGQTDPDNRRTFPWQDMDLGVHDIFRQALGLRRLYPFFARASLSLLSSSQDLDANLLAYGLVGPEKSSKGWVFLNRGKEDIYLSASLWKDMGLKDRQAETKQAEANGAKGREVLRAEGEKEAEVDSDRLTMVFPYQAPLAAGPYRRGDKSYRIPAGQGRVFIEGAPSQAALRKESMGVLMPLASLYSPDGMGNIGQAALDFVDKLVAAGQSIWQILPFHPVDDYGSPYAARSSFAGSPCLIDTSDLVELGLLKASDLILQGEKEEGEEVREEREGIDGREEKEGKEGEGGKKGKDSRAPLDYAAVSAYKADLLDRAYLAFEEKKDKEYRTLSQDFERFIAREADWLYDYALFEEIARQQGSRDWTLWPKALKWRDKEALEGFFIQHSQALRLTYFTQFIFFGQWQRLHDYAREAGLRLMGDLALYLGHDSADVWARPHLFLLDAEGRPSHVAGVPPDDYSPTGQRWGQPLYDWSLMARDDFSWMVARLAHLARWVDTVRIDHFRGLADYWEIPSQSPDARTGVWRRGPGRALLLAWEKAIPNLSLILEDLGILSERAKRLACQSGYPGMSVLQHRPHVNWSKLRTPKTDGAEADALDDIFKWSAKEIFSVLYPGTHDDMTLRSFLEKKMKEEGPVRTEELEALTDQVLENLYMSPARMVLVPMQDLLGLDDQARTNRPATTQGNWSWQMGPSDWTKDLKRRLLDWGQASGRGLEGA